MKLSFNTKLILFIFLIILNIILRVQSVSQEIGSDSFDIHADVNSITEFGYAKWVTSYLSFFGLAPASYSSAVQFFLSGIHQVTGIEMHGIIFMYDIFLGIICVFFVYIFAGEINHDDLFKFIASFGFSTSAAVLDFTTWTIPTRGLLVIMGPLLLFTLLRIYFSKNKLYYIIIATILSILLLATHHLFYFLLPSFLTLISLIFLLKINEIFKTRHYLTVILTFITFMIMFSIPFIFRKFIEESVYYPFYIDLFRYTGIFFLFTIAGLIYLSLKAKKPFGEWFLLLNSIFLIAFIYLQTYFKEFAAIFIILVACIGIVNSINVSNKTFKLVALFIILISSISFSAYYQFLKKYPEGREMSYSAYNTGEWLKNYGTGSAISNDLYEGKRISSVSETIHFISNSISLNAAYGFMKLNYSEFTYYPVTSEQYWYDVGVFKKAYGEIFWHDLNVLTKNPRDFNVIYVVDIINRYGHLFWNHGPEEAKLIKYVSNNENKIYNTNNINIYKLT